MPRKKRFQALLVSEVEKPSSPSRRKVQARSLRQRGGSQRGATQSGGAKAHLRIQIPAFNEVTTLSAVVQKALAAAQKLVCEGVVGKSSLLIIDDGSTDGTRELAAALARADPRIQIIGHARNRGLGASFLSGLHHARGSSVDVLVNLDADGQFDPGRMDELIRPVLEEGVGLATASRFAGIKPDPPLPRARFLGNALVAIWVSKIAGVVVQDASCGFRAFSAEALACMELEGGFTYTHETLIEVSRHKLEIVEVPMAVRGVRLHGQSRLAPSVLQYGVRASGTLVRAWWRGRRVRISPKMPPLDEA